jgi:CheY-like chemotaxis protein
MLQRMIGEDIRLVTSLQPSLGRVRADSGQIEQVLMNLIVNARDAMPQGGTVTIETDNIARNPDFAGNSASVRPGPHVTLRVRDTGCGMDEQTKARIFEPFFTTKEPGKGTGLGLSTVYGIVKQSGGSIQVDSAPGRGTTFTVYLPRVSDEAETSAVDGSGAAVPKGSETVLLVEDDEAIRSLARRILQTQGHSVLEALDAQGAIRLAETHPSTIHLLITDIVMPQMSGRELAKRLAALRPSMKVLYVSGYTDDAVIRHGISVHEVAFLQKPFSPDSLTRKVREVLDR